MIGRFVCDAAQRGIQTLGELLRPQVSSRLPPVDRVVALQSLQQVGNRCLVASSKPLEQRGIANFAARVYGLECRDIPSRYRGTPELKSSPAQVLAVVLVRPQLKKSLTRCLLHRRAPKLGTPAPLVDRAQPERRPMTRAFPLFVHPGKLSNRKFHGVRSVNPIEHDEHRPSQLRAHSLLEKVTDGTLGHLIYERPTDLIGPKAYTRWLIALFPFFRQHGPFIKDRFQEFGRP